MVFQGELTVGEVTALGRLESRLPDVNFPVGTQDEIDLVVRVRATVTRDMPGECAPTARALSLDAVALLLLRAGCQRDGALALLLAATQEDSLAETAKADPRVLEIREGVQAAMKGLPKIKKSGAIRLSNVAVERVAVIQVLGVPEQGGPVAVLEPAAPEGQPAGRSL